ncbi:uncharacterized protein LOC141655454 [Silene latifolia]|uniref:uncharacterized protein LOC141655454 n=1 Tax=Silene latifolia TaxID=37657 RepID=UPI003D77C612
MFLIPKCVIKRIEAICRNYLWDGSSEYHRVPLVAWDKVTLRNVAVVGKLVNWVYWKADRLFIRWVKDKLKDGFAENCWTPNAKGYTVRNGYVRLSSQQPKMDWCPLVWNNWNIPKHSIITWLIMQEGLNIKTRLFQLGYREDNLCLLCGELPETFDHHFHECIYSCKIKEATASWLG